MKEQVKGMVDDNDQLNSEMKSNTKIRGRKFKTRIANSLTFCHTEEQFCNTHVSRTITQPWETCPSLPEV